jgi:hypothetical protein
VPGVVGVDFDNTIVSYDPVFRALAHEWLAGVEGMDSRIAVRDHLHRTGQTDLWLDLQRLAYGKRISEAAPFPGVKEFLIGCGAQDMGVRIISHKSSDSRNGDGIDLRGAALTWLQDRGFFDDRIPLTVSDVYFEETREAKLERIASSGCRYFIDDLPGVLEDPGFPGDVQGILFDPKGLRDPSRALALARTWDEAGVLLGLDAAEQ